MVSERPLSSSQKKPLWVVIAGFITMNDIIYSMHTANR